MDHFYGIKFPHVVCVKVRVFIAYSEVERLLRVPASSRGLVLHADTLQRIVRPQVVDVNRPVIASCKHNVVLYMVEFNSNEPVGNVLKLRNGNVSFVVPHCDHTTRSCEGPLVVSVIDAFEEGVCLEDSGRFVLHCAVLFDVDVGFVGVFFFLFVEGGLTPKVNCVVVSAGEELFAGVGEAETLDEVVGGVDVENWLLAVDVPEDDLPIEGPAGQLRKIFEVLSEALDAIGVVVEGE